MNPCMVEFGGKTFDAACSACGHALIVHRLTDKVCSVCEAVETVGEPQEVDIPSVLSFVVESNVGGVPITLCSCGVLLLQSMASGHTASCPVLRAELRADL